MSLLARETETLPAAEHISALARNHAVRYAPRPVDEWAAQVTRLAGDDVELDAIECLLIALQRAGHISWPDALALQVQYLREARRSADCESFADRRGVEVGIGDAFPGNQDLGGTSSMMRFMKSSKSGTVKAVSPCAGA